MGLRDYLAGSSPERKQREEAKLSKELRDADKLFDEGIELREKREYTASIEKFKSAQEIYLDELHLSEVVDSGYNIAITLGDKLKRYREAIKDLKNLIELCNNLKWRADEIDLLLVLGLYSLFAGDKETARESYEKASQIAKKIKDKKREFEVSVASQKLRAQYITLAMRTANG